MNKARDRNMFTVLAICFGLASITWLVFGQTLRHDFVNYDDDDYVYENPRVTSGITMPGIKWAFTHQHAHNWHPLTTISHMLDCQLFGLKAGRHHFTNVVLHTVAVLLLFLLLGQMTGNIGRSAFVAAIFAIHPLRVESVAWIAERKDVLSAVFFMLTLTAYLHYTRKKTFARYVTMSILFACGLMSKPMLVTVPLVLLLLDYWPLRRITDRATLTKSALEKVPLLLLSLASFAATIGAQSELVGSMVSVPLLSAIKGALVAPIIYIAETLWPADLAVFYPHLGNHLMLWRTIGAASILIGVTAMAIGLRKTCPAILVGWAWYLGMLVPVIRLFQVDLVGPPDRYTYLPQIGLLIAFTWAVVDLSARWRYRKPALVIAATVLIGASAACAWNQTSFWENSGTLWKHALQVTPNNDVAHDHLGLFFEQSHNPDAAISEYESALQARYRLMAPMVHYNLGGVLFQKGQLDDAVAHYTKALQLQPDFANAHLNLGAVLFRKRLLADAVAHWEKALAIAPQSTVTLNKLALILATCSDARIRNGSRAIQLAEQADRLSDRKSPAIVRTLAAAYAEGGRFTDAIDAAERAQELALEQGNSALADESRMDIDLYRMNFPKHESGLNP